MKRTPLRRKRPLLASLERGITDARAGRLKSLGSFARKTRLVARKPMRKRNVKRHTKEWLRAYGSEERVTWIRSRGCVNKHDQYFYTSQNVHVRTGGTRWKADAIWIVPMCPECHRYLHQVGKQTFERAYHIVLDEAARATEAKWQAYLQQQGQA